MHCSRPLVGLIAFVAALAVGSPASDAPLRECVYRRAPNSEPPGLPMSSRYADIRERVPRSAGCEGLDDFDECSFLDASGYVNYIFNQRLGAKRAYRKEAGWLPFGVKWDDTPTQVARKLKTAGVWLGDGRSEGRRYVATNGCLLASTGDTFRVEFSFDAADQRLAEVAYGTMDD